LFSFSRIAAAVSFEAILLHSEKRKESLPTSKPVGEISCFSGHKLSAANALGEDRKKWLN